MELAKESDNDSESNQVLMYYKNYSQNPELSKYFTGPEASISKPNNPSSRLCLKSTNNSSTFNDHPNMIPTDPNIILMNHDEDIENKNISPSSSIASNKKLEWDNGADIGYKNSYKHSNIKSASFPSLLINDMTNLIEEKSISKNTQQIRSMYHQLTFSPEPSCSSTKENCRSSSLKTKITTDTSSSLNEATSKEPSPLSSGSGKNKLYLQRKIGQPVAYSTPYDDAVSSKSSDDFYRETPMLRIQSKPKRNLNENQLESSSGNYTSHDDNPVLHKDKNINNSESSYNAASNENVQQVLGMNKCTEESIQRVSKVQREINLCLTKPIFVECIYSSPKQNTNQKSQTSFALGKNSKSVQTEMIQINNKVIYSNPIEVCTPLIQKIEYVRYKKNDEPNCNMMLSGNINLQVGKTERFTEETNENVPDVESYNCPRNVRSGFKKSSEISAKKKDIKTVTDLESKGEELDKCDYVHDQSENIEVVTTTKGSSIIGTNSSISCPENISVKKIVKVFQESETPVNGSSSVATDKSVSDEMILSEMLSINHSRDLNTDIKRSISILQKLLSSKKYDEATKKYYIKKIVEKIVESKYSGDSTSSSELFRPKKNIVTGLDNQDKTHIPNSKSVKSNGSEIKLMQNIPWYPACDAKYISSKKKKKMDCKRTKTDIATGVRELRNTVHSISKDDVDLVMDEKFKITNNSEFLQNKLLMANSKYNTKATATKSSPTYQSSNDNVFKQPHAVASVDKMEDKKWKSVKTLSERLLENRDKIGQGDYLLHVATNERYHQLSWIKNEIEHLNKLKEMLERKIRPKPQVEDVVSSLLKMHVDDLQGLSKNHEVFICKCSSATKVQCKCDCLEKPSKNKNMKKSTNPISGYYTIQTQLDRHGNLLDLTVYDEKGTETYNYQHDGVADDVMVTSENRNTSVKLKPKAEKHLGYMKSRQSNECKCCGQLFSAPVANPEMCFKCLEAEKLHESTHSFEKNLSKHRKPHLEEKIVSNEHLNICICEKCLPKSKQNKQEIDSPSVCLARSTSNSSLQFKIHFMSPKRDSQKDLHNKYFDQIPLPESKCSCPKVTFSEQPDECICSNKDLLKSVNKNLNRSSSIPVSSTLTSTDEDSDKSEVTKKPPKCDICPRCRRKSLRCICYPKFVPKQPKLMGSGTSGPKFMPKKLQEKGRHENMNDAERNSGRSYRLNSKPAPEPKPHPTRTRSTSPDSKSDTIFPRTKKVQLDVKVGKDVNIKRKKKHRDELSGSNQLDNKAGIHSALTTQSKLKSLNTTPEKNSDDQAKKVQCCKACKGCNSSSSTSPRPSETQEKYKKGIVRDLQTPPMRENEGEQNVLWKCPPKCQDLNWEKTQSSVKKSCQCCTCTDCGIQTKKLGDKNARCQCCVCENCGIQAALDGNGRKPISSKWCQPKSTEIQVQQATLHPYSEKPPYRTQRIDSAIFNEDELDCTDESLESISSVNALCITPTKYKNKNKQKSKMNCDCVSKTSNSDSIRSFKSQKTTLQVQVCPRSMKTTCKSSSTTSADLNNSQTRTTCSPSCSKSLRVYSSSHTPATNFRSSPPDMEVSPNSPRWQRNRTIAGDTAATTQSKNKPQSKQCCCSPETCKCGQTSTHEEKHVQYSAFKQCICQTESEEGAKNLCSCKGDVDIPCKCEKKSCQCVEETVCKCKQSSSSSSSSSSKSLMSCICCKKEKLLKNIMNKLPLCNPCHDIHQKRFYPYEYSNPLHSCLCYSLIDQDTMSELKSTLTELERLEIYQQYCEVLKNCKCCKKCGCKCKLPKKFKNGCAYFLKLEDACPYECGEQEVCNCEDDGDYDEEKKENVLPEVTVKVPNCKGSCAQKKNSEMKMQQNCPSVMAYLCTMKPQFIERAERRRRILRNAALQREEDGETRKLNFLDQVNYLNQKYQNEHVSSETKMCGPYGNQTAAYCVFDIGLNAPTTNIKPRVFKSFKEMKDLTRRRYLHLSEVRNKKDVYKNKRLKEANRILANTFTKRLQRSTLRGNVDIPPCVRVISY